MQDFIRQVRRTRCCASLGLLVVGLGSSIFAANAEAQSCPRGSTTCTATATARALPHPNFRASASDQQTAQAQAASATGCRITGSWVEGGSWGTAGIVTVGVSLAGQNKHPYCSGPHALTVTDTGAGSFTAFESWGGGKECQSNTSLMSFGATCNRVSGSYTNADGSGGSFFWKRQDPLKNLGGGCQDTNGISGQPGQVCGDPINLTTGNVTESVADVTGTLAFARHYNSLSHSDGPLGHNWSHDFEARIESLTPTLVQAVRSSQKALTFNLVGGQWVADSDITSRLTKQVDGAGQTLGWRYVTGANGVESYDAVGRLVSIAYTHGATQSLNYDAVSGLLASVADTFGRRMFFTYDGSKRLSTVTEPNGGGYTYSYDGFGNLAWVVHPGGGALNYLYENSTFHNALTGLVDENGQRFSTWTYDLDGLAVSSEQPNGVGKVTVGYNIPATGQRTVTDSLGHAQTYEYYDIYDVLHTASADLTASGFPLRSNWTYFDDGSVASYIDYLGNLKCYGYEPTRNLESVKVEGLPYTADACQNLNLYPLPANARITASAWHPLWRLKTQVAEPKKLTTFVYNGQPNPVGGGSALNCAPTSATLPDGSPIAVLCKRIEQATTDTTGGQGLSPTLDTTVASRAWSYTYNQYGQVLSATDPRGNASTFIYYTSTTTDHWIGDLQSVTNAVGHVTQFTKYDLAGRLLRSVGPTGATTDTVYTPRGWVSSITVTPSGGGTAQVMGYTYDAAGQRKVATLPDGTTIQYGYDDAHRLTSITDGAGNSVTYTLDTVGNRIGEQRKDPGGTLARNITRAFDGLNQLKSVTGASQ